MIAKLTRQYPREKNVNLFSAKDKSTVIFMLRKNSLPLKSLESTQISENLLQCGSTVSAETILSFLSH